ncbi:MAG: RluA family pseudouridine synthase [Treponema sp.]|nr:RluA family pseudouridine synthase [Treponema sp.]
MAYIKASTQYKREHKADYGREKIEILYQDQWLCVIYKPTGLLSVPYPGSKVRTAQSVLEEVLRKQGTVNNKHKPYVVHRLDRDTSGVMMFALTEAAQRKIMDNWHKMVTERLYHALAENPKKNNSGFGDSKNDDLQTEGWITDALAQNAHNVGFVPQKGDLDKNGKPFNTVPARTHYKKILCGPTHTLFELSLDTGKKNQIRAHLAAHGFTLAGDEEHRAKTDAFHRLCLHARTLEFDHPFTGEHLKFEVAEPEEWAEYVKKGDVKPETPVWMVKNNLDGEKRRTKNHYEDYSSRDFSQKRLSAKDKAHMNYIESGKKHR